MSKVVVPISNVLAVNSNKLFSLTKMTLMLKEPLSGFQPVQSILLEIVAMLLKLIEQSRDPWDILDRCPVLFPDASVIFALIKEIVGKSSLDKIDIQGVISILPDKDQECTTCMEKLHESESDSHKICSCCGKILCSSCFCQWKDACLKNPDPIRRKVTCPSCRNDLFGLSLELRRSHNTDCWALIVFAIIFGQDFKSFHEYEKKHKNADGFQDPAILDKIWRVLLRKERELRFCRIDMGKIEVLTLRGSVVAADGAADGAADVAADVAADRAADMAADGASNEAAMYD
jgi:hypothetical protein